MSKDVYLQAISDNVADTGLKLMTDFKLWAYLFQGYAKKDVPHKYSKPEAFFDLIKRQRLAKALHDNEFLNGSILSLSKAWEWNRDAVKKFLLNLEQQGVVTIEQTNRRFLIQIKNIEMD